LDRFENQKVNFNIRLLKDDIKVSSFKYQA